MKTMLAAAIVLLTSTSVSAIERLPKEVVETSFACLRNEIDTPIALYRICANKTHQSVGTTPAQRYRVAVLTYSALHTWTEQYSSIKLPPLQEQAAKCKQFVVSQRTECMETQTDAALSSVLAIVRLQEHGAVTVIDPKKLPTYAATMDSIKLALRESGG